MYFCTALLFTSLLSLSRYVHSAPVRTSTAAAAALVSTGLVSGAAGFINPAPSAHFPGAINAPPNQPPRTPTTPMPTRLFSSLSDDEQEELDAWMAWVARGAPTGEDEEKRKASEKKSTDPVGDIRNCVEQLWEKIAKSGGKKTEGGVVEKKSKKDDDDDKFNPDNFIGEWQ